MSGDVVVRSVVKTIWLAGEWLVCNVESNNFRGDQGWGVLLNTGSICRQKGHNNIPSPVDPH